MTLHICPPIVYHTPMTTNKSRSKASPESLRLFIAIELPPTVTEALAALQKRLQTFDRERAIRWTAISSIHLTLKFLGDTDPARQPAIDAALREAVAGRAPFSLNIDGAGCFPDLHKPRIVWAGVGGDLAALHALRDAVERTVSPLDYPTEDRPFSPHLTLGRARQDALRQALAALGERIGQAQVGTLATWRVEGVSLMRSDPKPSGAVYTQVLYIPLGV
jgi:2'-5' RNA ligase